MRIARAPHLKSRFRSAAATPRIESSDRDDSRGIEGSGNVKVAILPCAGCCGAYRFDNTVHIGAKSAPGPAGHQCALQAQANVRFSRDLHHRYSRLVVCAGDVDMRAQIAEYAHVMSVAYSPPDAVHRLWVFVVSADHMSVLVLLEEEAVFATQAVCLAVFP